MLGIFRGIVGVLGGIDGSWLDDVLGSLGGLGGGFLICRSLLGKYLPNFVHSKLYNHRHDNRGCLKSK